MTEIDYSPLGRAIERLKEGLAALKEDPSNSLYRDAVIQRFEFTYELCAAFLARFVSLASPVPQENRMTFPALVRTASDMGILQSGWKKWHGFREARNLTSHTYNEEKAKAVVVKIPDFLAEAEFFYSNLAKAQDDAE